jgi:hypothetical protein
VIGIESWKVGLQAVQVFEGIRIGTGVENWKVGLQVKSEHTDGRTDGRKFMEGIGCSKLTYNINAYEEIFILRS